MSCEFSRFEMLVGQNNVNNFKSKHVAVFGIGGVGSYAAECIVRCGIGEITIIDNDIISESNINRQLFALHSTVDKKKVDVAKQRFLDINPNCKINTIDKFYTPENSDEFFNTNYDYIIDAIDTVTSKIDLIKKCYDNNIKIISSMGTGNKLDPTKFEVTDIFKTSTCPLCRIMRKELKNRGIKKLKVVYSNEQPIKPIANKNEHETNTPASCSFVPPVAGMILAGEVIKDLILTN